MENKRKRIIDFSLFIIIGIFILSAVLSCVSVIDVNSGFEKNMPTTNTDMTITTNTEDGLGEFNDGASYIYTDKDLVEKYRANDPSTPFDTKIQKVDKSTGSRGDKVNPYVISSVEEWTRFAKNLDDGTIPNKGSGKYFVLTKTLDFENETFRPIRFFNGTFYGQGNKLVNISLDRKSVV